MNIHVIDIRNIRYKPSSTFAQTHKIEDLLLIDVFYTTEEIYAADYVAVVNTNTKEAIVLKNRNGDVGLSNLFKVTQHVSVLLTKMQLYSNKAEKQR